MNRPDNTAEKRTLTGQEKTTLAVRILIIAAALAVYAVYAVRMCGGFILRDWLVSFVTLAAFTATVVAAVPKLIRTLSGESDVLLAKHRHTGRIFLAVCLGALALHIAASLIGTLIYKSTVILSTRPGLDIYYRAAWSKANTDAGHYMNIAENWYVNEGDDRLLIVFFPMLPVLIRALNALTHDSFLSAQIINTIATVLASGMTYLALTPVTGEKKARLGSFIALLLPGMIFLNSPMTEPLFLLFSACCFFFIQKRRLLVAGIFAALAGFTRSLGVLLALPIAIEGVCYIVRLHKNKKKWGRVLAELISALVISTFGTLGYLYINYSVTGDCLKFLEYQSLNWYQSFCPFFETVRYNTAYLEMAILSADASLAVMWITNLVMIFGSLGLIARYVRRLPSTYTFYFFAYFFVAIGCTWLLSGVRYLSVLLPLAAAIALGLDKKWKTALCFVILSLCYLGYMYLYMLRWSVY